jgi:hypothetical protein
MGYGKRVVGQKQRNKKVIKVNERIHNSLLKEKNRDQIKLWGRNLCGIEKYGIITM